MRKIFALISLAAFVALPLGCKRTTAPTPVALGYHSSVDQSLGETLAALNGFATQEKDNYATDNATIQAQEKPALNAFIKALNFANAAYVAYHAGTGTLTAAQSAVASAQAAQTNLINAKGVK